jgi:phosphate transport system ATP-binding protein
VAAPAKIEVEGLRVAFGANEVLKGITMAIPDRGVLAVIGPSGCGKSTFLRTLNRMNDGVPTLRLSGSVRLDGRDIYRNGVDVVDLRRRVGMVFQRPNPFPMTIYQNVAFGLRIGGERNEGRIREKVEASLRQAALWDEVADRLRAPALSLSGGQQQRLCIARALAVEPEVLLMDEPASALDPVSTAKIEELVTALKERYAIVVVTHNMQQAARISTHTAFLLSGELVEFGPTREVFTNPTDPRTEAYLTGRFG